LSGGSELKWRRKELDDGARSAKQQRRRVVREDSLGGTTIRSEVESRRGKQRLEERTQCRVPDEIDGGGDGEEEVERWWIGREIELERERRVGRRCGGRKPVDEERDELQKQGITSRSALRLRRRRQMREKEEREDERADASPPGALLSFPFPLSLVEVRLRSPPPSSSEASSVQGTAERAWMRLMRGR